jgi:hypothetical protein
MEKLLIYIIKTFERSLIIFVLIVFPCLLAIIVVTIQYFPEYYNLFLDKILYLMQIENVIEEDRKKRLALGFILGFSVRLILISLGFYSILHLLIEIDRKLR